MAEGGSRPPLPESVTAPLLDRIIEQSLDEDYRLAAARRGLADAPASPRRPGYAAAAVAVFGLLIAVSVVQATTDAGVVESGRSALVARVEARRQHLVEQQDRIVELRSQTASLARLAEDVGAAERAAVGRLRRLQLRAGYLPVRGPGVRIVADSAPDATPAERVRDEDLAMLVDGLWNAGAEAIAIDGERLTALSAIRNSGQTIRVNSRNLTPPYTVLAIGDTQSLQARLADSTHGLQWLSLVDVLRFRFAMENVAEVSIPAARPRPLRAARVLAEGALDPATGSPAKNASTDEGERS